MTPESSIPVALLCNELLLVSLLNRRIDGTPVTPLLDEGNMYETYRLYARREFQIHSQQQDNEIFETRWQCFCKQYPWHAGDSPVLAALEALHHEYIEERDNQIHIQLEKFGDWQNIVANINFQPLAAYAAQEKSAYKRYMSRYGTDGETVSHGHPKLEELIPIYPLCYPYDIAVEDYIRRHGLNDAHLHINACSFAEHSWLYAIHYPDNAFKRLIASGETPTMRQQFLEIYGKSAAPVILQHLYLARNLRIILRNHVENPPLYDGGAYCGLAVSFMEKIPDAMLRPLHTLGMVEMTAYFDDTDWTNDNYTTILRKERLWMSMLIRELKAPEHHAQKAWLTRLFHVYILLMNEFCGLFTQKETQKGFDQFNNSQNLRNAHAWQHHYYFELFKHFHGEERDSIVHYLDARIMAKPWSAGNIEQLLAVLRDYGKYLFWVKQRCLGATDPCGVWENAHLGHSKLLEAINYLEQSLPCRYLHLNLTAHFIKKPWTWRPGNRYRYNTYRKELRTACLALRQTFVEIPGVQYLFCAVDAANDEQYVPPAVFAPTFRYCRHVLNMENVTFHCGEDFRHLLTGIRVMNDAMEFLELRNGDRLGHGTALGMDPKHWRHRMPTTLYVRREDRMLDLLFALRILKLEAEVPAAIVRNMKDELMLIAHHLFDHVVPEIDLVTLGEAMRLRKLDPGTLLTLLGANTDACIEKLTKLKNQKEDANIALILPEYNEEDESHRHTVEELRKAPPYAIRLLMFWFTDKRIWEEGQRYVAVETKKEFDTLYRILQRYLMHEFHERRIVIETLMSSNLRIACYRKPEEHHVIRWLLKKPDIFKDDPKVLLAFGSDDPGIFTCDAKSEFYLLYASLLQHGVTEREAINLLDEVNDRGRSYSFRNTNKHITPS